MDFTTGSDVNAQPSVPILQMLLSQNYSWAHWSLHKICGKQEHVFLMTFYKHSQETAVPFQNTLYFLS